MKPGFFLFLLVAVAVFAWFTFRRFSNPDMTQTRLFMTYWYEWLIGIGAVFVTYLLTRDAE